MWLHLNSFHCALSTFCCMCNCCPTRISSFMLWIQVWILEKMWLHLIVLHILQELMCALPWEEMRSKWVHWPDLDFSMKRMFWKPPSHEFSHFFFSSSWSAFHYKYEKDCLIRCGSDTLRRMKDWKKDRGGILCTYCRHWITAVTSPWLKWSA